jgi:hypothetical protein
MPKLYDYFGLIVMFYANEHEPVHVHGKSQGREARAEFIIVEGEVIEINFAEVTGRQPLQPNEMRYFKEIVTAKTDEIIQKWIDFFVLHKYVTVENITRRLK